MLSANEDGGIDLLDLKSNILHTYRFIHKFLVTQLDNFNKTRCIDLEIDQEFVNCPNYNQSRNYNLDNMICVSKKLKNRLLQTDEELNIIDIHQKKLKNSFIYKIFKLSFNVGEYWDFLPKNIILYDFMMNGQNVYERDITFGSQARQYQILENERPKYVLDILRFAPLNKKCGDGSQVTLFDLFRYVKYTIYRSDVVIFHSLVLAATFRPFALIIRFYIKIFSGFKFIYNLKKPDNTIITFYNNMRKVGSNIIDYFQFFIDLNIFGDGPTKIFRQFLIQTIECIDNLNNNKYFNKTLVADLSNALKKFIYDNKMDCKIPTDAVTLININAYYEELIIQVNQIGVYIKELEKNIQLFNYMKKTGNVDLASSYPFIYMLKPFTLDLLCQSDFYAPLKKLDEYYNTQISDVKEMKQECKHEITNKDSTEVTSKQHLQNDIVPIIRRWNIITYNESPRYFENYFLSLDVKNH
ncbi:uncharacterized protein LOC126907949 [Daktulosphaira vitifoliae]|uniref:uncharacterized protein LOC126907949 n=1 Tax=Daktulosphaira vitifoliae TaxID=58002 RepID=UPI0021A99537|nr:uncharacterized protein LOC126907949 [Daktulosphaira vitifoliae]